MRKSNSGFSLIELILVLGLLAILGALAYPSFQSWRANAQYREAARTIASTLREARSAAISTNLQHKVDIKSAGRTYLIRRGNQAASTSSTNWTNVSSGVLPSQVQLSAGLNIDFFPNGSASSIATIQVQDKSEKVRFTVGVESQATGRIVIKEGP